MTKLQREDDNRDYSYVKKKTNRMSIQLQALVHDYPSQLTAGKIFGTVMTKVHTPRPSIVSVRDGTDQPNDCFHSLECMEKVMSLRRKN